MVSRGLRCGGDSDSTALSENMPSAPSTAAQAATTATTVLTVRAKGSLYGGVGPKMVVRVNQTVVGTVEVKNTAWENVSFSTPTLRSGNKVDLVFTNDTAGSGGDRNLYIASLGDGATVVLPSTVGAVIDRGGSVSREQADTSGYRALICLYLAGGNDAHSAR